MHDLNICRSQFLVVNPRYDPAEAAKVLTRARQLKKRICRLLSKSLPIHIICIYICCACVSNKDFASSLNLKFTFEGTQMTRGSQVSSGTTWTSEMALWKNEPEYCANRRQFGSDPMWAMQTDPLPYGPGDSVRNNFEYDSDPFSAWHFCDRCAARAERRSRHDQRSAF